MSDFTVSLSLLSDLVIKQGTTDSILDQYRTNRTNTDCDVTVLSRDVTMTAGDVTASVSTNDTTGAAVNRTEAQNASVRRKLE